MYYNNYTGSGRCVWKHDFEDVYRCLTQDGFCIIIVLVDTFIYGQSLWYLFYLSSLHSRQI